MSSSNTEICFPTLPWDGQNGILDVRLHTNGGSLKWGITAGAVHDQLGEAFYKIGRDAENRVMILRGSGDNYCVERNLDEYKNVSSPEAMYRMIREGRDILTNMLEIETPIISLIHGPATLHPEIPGIGRCGAGIAASVLPGFAHPGGTCSWRWVADLLDICAGPNACEPFFLHGAGAGCRGSSETGCGA